ncbi:MAG: hypothetical protein HOI66_20470 [Verrucomicrobia bacterium]|jgi:hypothetical protein|nr:hypothetical protein [Verrucomicrobiota bacterium]MDA7645480.1 hypothetical protein [bacterium]
MKSKNLVIALSLALNIALGVALFLQSEAKSTSESATVGISQHNEEKSPMARLDDTNSLNEEIATATQTFTWESVESGDYLTYIENLRSIGCPEDTIRDIISADVNKLYNQRWKEIKQASGNDKFEYWKSSAMFGGMSSELRKQFKEHDDERRQTLQSLLGQKIPRKITDLASIFDPFENMLAFLPQSKRDSIMEIQQLMSERMMEAAEEGNNLEAADWHKVQQEQKDALAELLTPEELTEYNLRMSNSANMLRSELGGFEVSEDEFRNLYTLRETFDEEYGMLGPSEGQDAQEWYQQRSEGEKEMKTAYKDVLGDDRYREYQHEQTLRGSSLRKVAKEFELPREDLYDVFDATDAAQEAAAVIRENQNLSNAERQAALDQIRSETESQLTKLIGDDATQSYIEQGSRIRNLNSNGQQTIESSTMVAPAQVIRFSQ